MALGERSNYKSHHTARVAKQANRPSFILKLCCKQEKKTQFVAFSCVFVCVSKHQKHQFMVLTQPHKYQGIYLEHRKACGCKPVMH